MRFTIAKKIWVGCVIIVAFGTVAMLVTFRGLQRVQRGMRKLADVNEPIKWATHEMEINVNEIAIGTLGYLGAPHPKFREFVTNDENDFERFHADYLRLAITEPEKDFGQAVGRLFEEFRTQSRELKDKRDRQASTFADVVPKLEEMDHTIDRELQATLDPRHSDDLVKLQALNAVEADIGEVGMLVANYRWSPQGEDQALIVQNIEECRATLARLKSFEWPRDDQRSAVRTLEEIFEYAKSKIIEVMADEDEIQRGTIRFLALRDEMDAMLDEQMQPLAVELLGQPHRDADAATASVVFQIGWLIPLLSFHRPWRRWR